MFDCFVTENLEGPNMDLLGEMFDQRYRERELPDDLFGLFVPQGLTQQDEFFISAETDSLGEVECSRIERVVMSDDPEEEYVIEVGPKNVDRPSIYIEPDYIPALTTLKWYMEFMVSSTPTPLPYIEVAKMNIPPLAGEVSPAIRVFDDFFSQKEGLIFGPTYQFTQENPSNKFVLADVEEEANVMMNTKMQKYAYKFVFSSKYPFRSSTLAYPYRFLWMEFNPYHPLAPRFIQNYSISGSIIKGTYQIGRKIKDFRFDTMDRKYRIHSEQWCSVFPEAHRYMAMFDIVANFDVVSMIPELFGHTKKMTRYDGRYVDLYMLSDNVVKSPYSPMINERGYSQQHQMVMYSYYSSYPINMSSGYSGEYYDVTAKYEMHISESMGYDVRISRKLDGVIIARLRLGSPEQVIDYGYYIYFTIKGHLEVYLDKVYEEKEIESPNILVKKTFLEGVFYVNMARNSRGTLINPIGVVDYDTFFKQTREYSTAYVDAMPTNIEPMFSRSVEESIRDDDALVSFGDPDEQIGFEDYDKTYEEDQKKNNVKKIRQFLHDDRLSTWEDKTQFRAMESELDVPSITRIERMTPGVLIPDVLDPQTPASKLLSRNQGEGRAPQESRTAAAASSQRKIDKKLKENKPRQKPRYTGKKS